MPGPDEREVGGLMLTERNMHTYVQDLEQHLVAEQNARDAGEDVPISG